MSWKLPPGNDPRSKAHYEVQPGVSACGVRIGEKGASARVKRCRVCDIHEGEVEAMKVYLKAVNDKTVKV